ncbi:MAG TPA: GNAT family N-acetyltransferase [Gaiella sp.]|nr:GNAT family N-acetyltransferase [Gaiella sp.]
MDVEHLTEAVDVLASAGPLLLADEARHNLALGILSTARALPGVYPALLGWVARDEGRVVGVAIRTPPHNLVLARPTSPGAIEALAEAIATELPGVVGAVPEVDSFASAWAGRHGLEVRTAFDQRIYALRELAPTKARARRPAPCGRRRTGTPARVVPRVRDRGPGRYPRHRQRRAQRRRSARGDRRRHRPVGGGWSGGVARRVQRPHAERDPIGPVYTPPEHRNHGYGTAVTAALSRLLLERGHRFCFLFTDLANPTSNAIYARIGYEPVCDSRELAFVRRH